MSKKFQKGSNLYVQYGCGTVAPEDWINFDASPTLRIQKIPIIGRLLNKRLNVVFPTSVKYGDIVKGLSIKDNSVSGLFCSHVLEHLSFEDFKVALLNSFNILKKGGIFRCVVPDLESASREYINALDNGDSLASIKFMGENTLIGTEYRARGIKGMTTEFFGNSRHLWMWDKNSLIAELENVGFIDVKICQFNDCDDNMFLHVENEDRFTGCVAVECRK